MEKEIKKENVEGCKVIKIPKKEFLQNIKAVRKRR